MERNLLLILTLIISISGGSCAPRRNVAPALTVSNDVDAQTTAGNQNETDTLASDSGVIIEINDEEMVETNDSEKSGPPVVSSPVPEYRPLQEEGTSRKGYSKKIGFNFGAGSSAYVGALFHFNSVYCLNPLFPFFSIGDNPMIFGVEISNRFYLSPMRTLDHYLYGSFGFVYHRFDEFTYSGIGYGLQYQINENVSLFGEIGVTVFHDEITIDIGRSGLGVIFYAR